MVTGQVWLNLNAIFRMCNNIMKTWTTVSGVTNSEYLLQICLWWLSNFTSLCICKLIPMCDNGGVVCLALVMHVSFYFKYLRQLLKLRSNARYDIYRSRAIKYRSIYTRPRHAMCNVYSTLWEQSRLLTRMAIVV